MSTARKTLESVFHHVRFTDTIVTPAYGKTDETELYANLLAVADTQLSQAELSSLLKTLEREMGDCPALRKKGIVLMDIDLLEYNGQRYHKADWERPYTKTLLKLVGRLAVILFLAVTANISVGAQQRDDTELLGKAVEYYHGGKYHECIITFEKLKRNYNLSSRFSAYLGFSYYKEQQYEKAVENLQNIISELSGYSPKERAVYIYSCAESLFFLNRYKEALEFYEMALPLTTGNDRGDVLFHMAFSHYLMNISSLKMVDDTIAVDNIYTKFLEARNIYQANSVKATSLQRARLKQTETMLKGLEKLRIEITNQQ